MALSVKVGSFTTAAAPGNQAVTGLGFTPKLVIFEGLVATSSVAAYTLFGCMDHGGRQWVTGTSDAVAQATTQAQRVFQTAACISIVNAATGVETWKASYVSMDADGFTVNWSAARSAAPVRYIALGGSDVSAFVGNFNLNGSTGPQFVNGAGFRPRCVLFGNTLGSTTPGVIAGAFVALGAARSSAKRWTLANTSANGGVANTASIFLTGKAGVRTSASAVIQDFDLTRFTIDGFRLNVTTSTVSTIWGYIALGGTAEYDVGTFAEQAGTGTQAVRGVGFAPSLVLFASESKVSGSAVTSHFRSAVGAMTAAGQFAATATAADTAGTSDTARYRNDAAVIGHVSDGGTPIVNALAAYSSLDADGFTVNWSTNDGTARVHGYLAIGAAVSPGSTMPVAGTAPAVYNTYSKRKSHRIVGSRDGALTNHPVKITVNAGAGTDADDDVYVGSACQADFDDVRFADIDGVALDHWREAKTDSTSATFWVKVPSIPEYPGTVDIQIVYGHASASTGSSAGATFPVGYDARLAEIAPATPVTATGLGVWDLTGNPWLSRGTAGDFDDNYIYEEGNIVHDTAANRYILYYTGFDGTSSWIMCATMPEGDYPDGTWTKQGRCFSSEQGEDPYVVWDPVKARWHMLFEPVPNGPGAGSAQGRYATSAAGLVFTVGGNVAFTAGTFYAVSPAIWLEGSTWHMIYENYDTQPFKVRHATSADGINWTDDGVFFGSTDAGAHVSESRDMVPDDVVKIGSTYYCTYHYHFRDTGQPPATFYGGEGLISSPDNGFDTPTRVLVPMSMMNLIGSKVTQGEVYTNVMLLPDTSNGQVYAGARHVFNRYRWLRHPRFNIHQAASKRFYENNGLLEMEGTDSRISSVGLWTPTNALPANAFTIRTRLRYETGKKDFVTFAFGTGTSGPQPDRGNGTFAPVIGNGYDVIWKTSGGNLIVDVDKHTDVYPTNIAASKADLTNGGTPTIADAVSGLLVHEVLYHDNGTFDYKIAGVSKYSTKPIDTTFIDAAKALVYSVGNDDNDRGGLLETEYLVAHPMTANEPTHADWGAEEAVAVVAEPRRSRGLHRGSLVASCTESEGGGEGSRKADPPPVE